MGVPIRLVWKRLVDAVIEVLVVGEDDVTANIVELSRVSEIAWKEECANVLTKPSGVVSVEARPPGTSLESTMSHEGSFCALLLVDNRAKDRH